MTGCTLRSTSGAHRLHWALLGSSGTGFPSLTTGFPSVTTGPGGGVTGSAGSCPALSHRRLKLPASNPFMRFPLFERRRLGNRWYSSVAKRSARQSLTSAAANSPSHLFAGSYALRRASQHGWSE